MLRDLPRQALLPLLAGAALTAAPGDGGAIAAEIGVSEGTNIAVSAYADGRAVVFDLYDRLWRVPRRGGMAQPLTGPELALRRPDVSDDGTIVAEGGTGAGRKLWLLRPDGSPQQLTDGDGRDITPRWYPDGRRVIFSSDRAGSMDLYQVRVSDGAVRRLTQTPATDELEPTVSASGRLTAWITRTASRWELWLQDGGGAPRLLHAAEHRLSAPSIRPDDSVIVLVEEPPDGSRLTAVILSDPAIGKPLATGEDFFRRPVEWLDRNHLLYTADGRIRSRGFGELRGRDLPWTAWVSSPGPSHFEPRIEADTPLLHHGRYVLRVGRVFDGRHPVYREDIDVVVEDDRIVEVGARRPREGMDVLAFPDAVLMPGLLQLGLADGASAGDGPLLLGCGVTTVVDLPSRTPSPSGSLSDWNTGEVRGPTIVSGHSRGGGLVDVRGIADRARRLARIREARAAGATVITDRLYPDLAAGASLLAGGSELPTSPQGRQYADVRRLLAASGARLIADRPGNPVTAELPPGSPMAQLAAAAQDLPGDRLARACAVQEQLRRLQSNGASAYESLQRHTADAARLVGLEDSRGVVAPGRRADLLLVGGDPLHRAGDAGRVEAVIAGGRFFTPAGLVAGTESQPDEEVSNNLTIMDDSEEMSPIRDTFDIRESGDKSWRYPPAWR